MNEIGMVDRTVWRALSRSETPVKRSSGASPDRFLKSREAGLRATYSPRTLHARMGASVSTQLSSPSLNRSLVGLNKSERETVRRLEARDQVVRQHEARHARALGAYAGVIRYTLQVGPDGRSYAVGGSIEVNAMPARTPGASVAKARMLRAAALAGGEPSGADLAMAIEARRMEQTAREQMPD